MSLLQDPSVATYYLKAKDNIEYKSAAFWFAVLRRHFTLPPFEISPEVSPDGSLRRVDALVERYDPAGNAHVPTLWVEFKRPTGSTKEVEEQALDAALRCIDELSLASIWVMTTIGVKFRLWEVKNRRPRLLPLHGADTTNDRSQYIDAGSRDASVFRELVQMIIASVILVDPPVVPSQSWDLAKGIPDTGLPQSSMYQDDVEMGEAGPSRSRRTTPSSRGDRSRSSGRSPSGSAGGSSSRPGASTTAPHMPGESSAAPPMPGPFRPSANTAPPPMSGASVAGPSRASGAGGSNDRWVEVQVRRVKHRLSPDDYIFNGIDGKERTTDKKHWQEHTISGRRAWVVRGRKTTYYTFKLG